jgi:hypothetical protein
MFEVEVTMRRLERRPGLGVPQLALMLVNVLLILLLIVVVFFPMLG